MHFFALTAKKKAPKHMIASIKSKMSKLFFNEDVLNSGFYVHTNSQRRVRSRIVNDIRAIQTCGKLVRVPRAGNEHYYKVIEKFANIPVDDIRVEPDYVRSK
jgi:hypothetical protein